MAARIKYVSGIDSIKKDSIKTELLLTGTFWRHICSKWKQSLRGIVGLKYIAICQFRLSFRIGLQMHPDRYESHFDCPHVNKKCSTVSSPCLQREHEISDDNLAFVLHVARQWRSIRKRIYNRRIRGLRIFVMYGLISNSFLTVDHTRKRTDEVISPPILCKNWSFSLNWNILWNWRLSQREGSNQVSLNPFTLSKYCIHCTHSWLFRLASKYASFRIVWPVPVFYNVSPSFMSNREST